VRVSWLEGEGIGPVLRWHQLSKEQEGGEAWPPVKDADVIPAETGRLCVIGDGAEWSGQPVQALFPQAGQGRESSHGAADRHKVAQAPDAAPLRAQAWTEATLPRLSLGKVGQVRGGRRRMQPTSDDALQAMDHCWGDRKDHRRRTPYRPLRRGGDPVGSGGRESANKFLCHGRVKRSGAWGYEDSSKQRWALRCAK